MKVKELRRLLKDVPGCMNIVVADDQGIVNCLELACIDEWHPLEYEGGSACQEYLEDDQVFTLYVDV